VVGILCAKVDMENVFNSNAEYVEWSKTIQHQS
jgi:hypothetical protein